jgi:hypothetical protein
VAIIAAASASQVDVQAAIDDPGTQDGDTITVPSGTETWSTQVTCDKGLSFIGAGIGNTVITGTSDYRLLSYEYGATSPRISGFTFKDGGKSIAIADGAAADNIGPTDFRIDNCRFETAAYYGIEAHCYTYGVIDNCQFYNTRGGVDYCSDGTQAWNRSQTLGDKYCVFIEDCTFTADSSAAAGHVIAGGGGMRIVFRYNTIAITGGQYWSDTLDAHGLCYVCYESNDMRGTRHFEIYENTSSTAVLGGRWCNLRGGSGVVYNNTLTGTYNISEVYLDNYRSWTGCQSPWNTLCQDVEGYPCQDQIQELYIWGNTVNGGPITTTVRSSGETRTHIQEDRDFFLSEKSGYTPYTYPHPLRELNTVGINVFIGG